MVVRMRINRSATKQRRSHHGLEGPRLSKCGDCGAMQLRHRACVECGKYRGRVVNDVEAKAAKKAGKRIQKLEAQNAIPKEEAPTAKDEKPTKSTTAAKATKATRTTSK